MPNNVDAKPQNPSEMRKKLRAIRIQKQIAKHEAEIKQIEKHHNKMNEEHIEEAKRDEPAKPDAKAAARRKAIEKAQERRAAKNDDWYADEKPKRSRRMGGSYGYGQYDESVEVEEGTDVEDAPFKGGHEKRDYKDRFGNMVKKKNVAKHLAKKGMKSVQKEEVEQLDELSKNTLQAYGSKALADRWKSIERGSAALNNTREKGDRYERASKKHFDKAAKRAQGGHLAGKKLDAKLKEESLKVDPKLRKSAEKMMSDMKKKGKGDEEIMKALQSKFPSMFKEACWDGYEKKGMKKKNGKEVPNCVKKESYEDVMGAARERREQLDEISNQLKFDAMRSAFSKRNDPAQRVLKAKLGNQKPDPKDEEEVAKRDRQAEKFSKGIKKRRGDTYANKGKIRV